MPEISKVNKDESEYGDSFQYLLDILKMEIGIIDHALARIDDITTSHRNWAVVLWAGAMGLALQQPVLQKYIIFTSAIPLLFWVIHMRWLYFLYAFVYREKKIAEYLNGDDFQMSFKQRKIVNFNVLDPPGITHRNEKNYKKEVNMRRAFKSGEIRIFYLGMVFLSLLTGAYFLFAK